MKPATKTLVLLSLALLPATPLSSCRCNWFMPKSNRLGSESGVSYELTVASQRNFGLKHAGQGHVGVIWPGKKGYGIAARLRVLNRPPIIVFAVSGLKQKPKKEELQQKLEGITVRVSADRNHLAVQREPSAPWEYYHLLPQGPPFSLGRSSKAAAPDFATLKQPFALALDYLKSDDLRQIGPRLKYPGAWNAIVAQQGPSKLDEAMVVHWPTSHRVHLRLVGVVTKSGNQTALAKELARLIVARAKEGASRDRDI